MQWKLQSTNIPKNIEEIVDIVLDNRGITDKDVFIEPLHPKNISLEDVLIKKEEVSKTVARIQRAIDNKEKILIYGDYDADGICATTVLWKTLHAMGANAIPFIPEREKHGYGISKRCIPDIQLLEPDLIITVDNGIVAHDAVTELVSLGFDVIITDHHQPESDKSGENLTYPAAYSIVHTTSLCGTTVAWMLSRELDEKTALTLLEFCAISSIADQVPLLEANRSFVFHGLEELRKTTKVGILELCTIASIELKTVTAGTIGYQLAPRINAMGRIAHGMDALRLLCTESKTQAQTLAVTLQQTNSDRQLLTTDMFEEALIQVADQKDEHVLFVYSEHFHEGVIGLIAGKLTEKFYKPAIAMSVSGDFAKASARSVKGVSIIDMLREIRSDLLEVGGHMLAGGFSLHSKNIILVKDRLQTLARQKVAVEMLERYISVDCELPLHLITVDTSVELKKLEPCGQGNPHPVFMLKDVLVKTVQVLGKDNQHRKIMLSVPKTASPLKQLQQIPGLWWNVPDDLEISEGDTISLVVTLDLNHYKGRTSVQVMIKDIKRS